MHASIYEVKFESNILKSKNPFIPQLLTYLLSRKEILNENLLNHFIRGINIANESQTRILSSPNFPIKSYKGGYLIRQDIEYGLSGGNSTLFTPNFLEEEYHFFWHSSSPLSQWHICEFVVDEIKFTSTEQYMMYEKAKLFNDEYHMNQILETDNPRKQKEYGRLVGNFDATIWNEKSLKIVYAGNYQKFSQNEKLRNHLVSTKGKTIVEASPYDKIWGIGLSKKDSSVRDIREWKGRNLLGIILTEVRENLLGKCTGIGYKNVKDLESNRYKYT
ncbi:hypothetical protein CEQ90_20380 [Lewinellaceae bacterium SD302]|nr:hypothetical protein CEQ90_20380 [Lewinellaceae bacterium SD302]